MSSTYRVEYDDIEDRIDIIHEDEVRIKCSSARELSGIKGGFIAIYSNAYLYLIQDLFQKCEANETAAIAYGDTLRYSSVDFSCSRLCWAPSCCVMRALRHTFRSDIRYNSISQCPGPGFQSVHHFVAYGTLRTSSLANNFSHGQGSGQTRDILMRYSDNSPGTGLFDTVAFNLISIVYEFYSSGHRIAKQNIVNNTRTLSGHEMFYLVENGNATISESIIVGNVMNSLSTNGNISFDDCLFYDNEFDTENNVTTVEAETLPYTHTHELNDDWECLTNPKIRVSYAFSAIKDSVEAKTVFCVLLIGQS